MPGVMGGALGKSMGPIMTALGTALAFVPGGQAFAAPLAMGGLSQMMGQGGVLGPSAPPAGLPSIKAPALSSAPMGPPATPDIPSPAGSGLSLSVPGAGASSGTGAGTNTDITNLIAQAVGTGGGGSPFAAFGS